MSNIDTYLEHSIRKDGWIPYHSIKIKKIQFFINY